MDDKKRTARYWIAFFILAVFLVILFVWNVNAGSIHLSVGEILNIIFRHQGDATAYNIIWEIRLPRILSVIILGGALSVSGFLLQTFFNNPIAGPFVLGISSGAKLVVALLMIYFLSRSISMGSAAMIIAAFIGSMISMGFVLLVAKKVHNMSMLVISGVMIGYICSAVTEFVVAFAQDSNIVNLHNWSQGSFSGMTWGNVQAAALVVLPALAAAFCLSKPMSAYQMGEAYAQSVGVNVFPGCWYCFPVCWRPVSRPLRGPSPLWASQCRIWSSICWAAQSRWWCCRAAAWAGPPSVCCAI